MSDNQQITITLTGRDNISRTFVAVGKAGQQAGDQITKGAKSGAQGLDALGRESTETGRAVDLMGKEAADAAKEADKLATSTDKSASALSSHKDAARDVGAAIGVAASALALMGDAAVQQERQVNALRKVYGDAADEIIDFTEAIQDNTNFSNEQARAAAQNAATLATNYGFTTEQITGLIERTADLAEVQGMDLTDAIQRTQSAMRGEGESAEALGLTLSDSAVAAYAAREGIDNYSTGLDEAGRAAVRYQYFLEQSAYAAGTAAEAASGARGATIDFMHGLQDLAASAGGAIGPVGEVASVGAQVALALPLVGAGAGKMVAGLRAASVASLGLVGAMGPVGLTLAAGAAVIAITEATGVTNLFGQEASAAAVQTDEFAMALAQIRAQAGESINLAWIDTTVAGLQSLDDQMATLLEKYNAPSDFLFFDQDALPQEFWDEYYRIQELGLTQEQIDDVTADIMAALTTPNINRDEVIGVYQDLFAQWQAGDLEAAEFVAAVDAVNGELHTFISVAGEAAGATQSATERINESVAAWRERQAVVDGMTVSGERWQAQADALGLTEEQLGTRADEVTALLGEQGEALAEAGAESAALANTYRSALVPAIEGFGGALSEIVPVGSDVLDVLTALADAGQIDITPTLHVGNIKEGNEVVYEMRLSWLEVANGAQIAGEQIDRTLALYGGIDDISARMERAAGIASDLFGGDAYDGLGPLVDLLNQGRISWDEFNAAVASGLSIQGDAWQAEQALNEIRVAQLPTLERQAQTYMVQIEHLASLTAEEQAHALAMMDSGNQAAIATAYSTAYSASLGEIPEDVATDIIANAARADPVIAGLLTEFGLIEQGANGDIRVNFPDGESMVSVTKDLTESINELIQAIDGVPPEMRVKVGEEGAAETTEAIREVTGLVISADGQSMRIIVEGVGAEETKAVIDDTYNRAENLDGTTAVVQLAANETGVMSLILEVGNELAVIDGTGATVYVGGDATAAMQAVRDADYQVAVVDGTTGTVYVLGDNADVLQKAADAHAARNGVDGTTANVTMYGDATGVEVAAGDAHAARNGVDGTGATVYIYGDDSQLRAVLNNVPQGRQVGSGYVWITAQGPGIGFSAYQHGGPITAAEAFPHAQHGMPGDGRTVLVGEAGPELVTLPVGSVVINHTATEAMLAMWERAGMPGLAHGGVIGGPYLQAIKEDGDWLNDWLTSIPRGTQFRDALRSIWTTPNYRDALRKYMAAVLDDGDWGNDWVGYLPVNLRSLFMQWGEYIAEGLHLNAGDAGRPGSPRYAGRTGLGADADRVRVPGSAIGGNGDGYTTLPGYTGGDMVRVPNSWYDGRGGGGNTQPPVCVNINGPVYGVDDFERRVADAATKHLVPAIRRANDINNRSMGVQDRVKVPR
jgi:hypothetical protein